MVLESCLYLAMRFITAKPGALGSFTLELPSNITKPVETPE